MRNWYFDIYRFLYYLVRPNYALTQSPPDETAPREFNKFYLFLAACLYPLWVVVQKYNTTSAKMFALASNDGSYISVQAYLDNYYGTGAGYKAVTVVSAFQTASVILTPEPPYTPDTPVAFYPQNYNSGQNYVSMRPRSVNAGWAVITVDATLLNNTSLYDDLVADINSLIMYGLQYELKTY